MIIVFFLSFQIYENMITIKKWFLLPLEKAVPIIAGVHVLFALGCIFLAVKYFVSTAHTDDLAWSLYINDEFYNEFRSFAVTIMIVLFLKAIFYVLGSVFAVLGEKQVCPMN